MKTETMKTETQKLTDTERRSLADNPKLNPAESAARSRASQISAGRRAAADRWIEKRMRDLREFMQQPGQYVDKDVLKTFLKLPPVHAWCKSQLTEKALLARINRRLARAREGQGTERIRRARGGYAACRVPQRYTGVPIDTRYEFYRGEYYSQDASTLFINCWNVDLEELGGGFGLLRPGVEVVGEHLWEDLYGPDRQDENISDHHCFACNRKVRHPRGDTRDVMLYQHFVCSRCHPRFTSERYYDELFKAERLIGHLPGAPESILYADAFQLSDGKYVPPGKTPDGKTVRFVYISHWGELNLHGPGAMKNRFRIDEFNSFGAEDLLSFASGLGKTVEEMVREYPFFDRFDLGKVMASVAKRLEWERQGGYRHAPLRRTGRAART